MPILYRSVLLRELPPQRLDAVHNALEIIFLLESNLFDHIGLRVFVLVRPLNVEGVEVDLHHE